MAGSQRPPKERVIEPQMRSREAARAVAQRDGKAAEQGVAVTPCDPRAAAAGAPSGQLKVITNEVPLLKPGGDPKDRELATRVLKAQHQLQEAMDAAVLAGLIIEPCFTSYPNRFKELGNDKDSYVAKIEIYRRLA